MLFDEIIRWVDANLGECSLKRSKKVGVKLAHLGRSDDRAPRNGAAFGAAFQGEFEGDHNIKDLLRCDQQWSFGEDGVADVGVELAPIAEGRDFASGGRAVFDKSEFAEIFFPFYDPRRTGRNIALAKIGFERIEFALEVTSLFTEDDEARA